jgi:hypothetical protein
MQDSVLVNVEPPTIFEMGMSSLSHYQMSRSGSFLALGSSACAADEACNCEPAFASRSALDLAPTAPSCTSTSVAESSAVLKDSDIVCGKSTLTHSHPGNKRYNKLIEAHAKQYRGSSKRDLKSMVTTFIISQVENVGGRFLSLDKATGQWKEVRTSDAAPCGEVPFAAFAHPDLRYVR